MKIKIVFIVIDGLGDKPIQALGNKTPLGAAKTPNLDWLAKNGICGLVVPFKFPWQKYPESDICHLALFGYDPKIYYLGRGPYEVVGAGMQIKEGDVALRANFATVSTGFKVIDRRAGRISETQSLIKAISGQKIQGIKFLMKKSFGHRVGLILMGKNLSAEITDADPKETNKPVKKINPKKKSKEAIFTARVLNRFLLRCYQILENHPINKKRELAGLLPANFLLVRGAGEFKKTPSFYQKYKLKACCIAGGNLYKGIGKALGMKVLRIKGATGLSNTNLSEKIKTIKESLKKYDFVFCHIKATDSFAEDGNYFGKKKFIEKIDKSLKPIPKLKNTLIVITGDHSTCSTIKKHCSVSVPFLIYKSGMKRNGIDKFSELFCKKGKLGKIRQLNLMAEIQTIAKD